MLGDLILVIVLYALSIVVFVDTSKYGDFSNLMYVGPEVFPRLVAWIFVIGATVILIGVIRKAFIKKVDENGVSYIEIEKAKVKEACSKMFGTEKQSTIRTILTIVLMILYAFMLPKVGYEICTIVFLLATMLLNGIRKPHVLAIVSVATVVVVYIFFVMLLKIQIPRLFNGF